MLTSASLSGLQFPACPALQLNLCRMLIACLPPFVPLRCPVQVLLSLPSFVADLKQGRQQLQAAGQPLDAGGVYSAVLDCVAARDNTSNSG